MTNNLETIDECVVTGNPFVVGYDCRCRYWYIKQSEPSNQPYTLFTNVRDVTGFFTYFTLTDYTLFKNGSSAVVATDLNMRNPFFD